MMSFVSLLPYLCIIKLTRKDYGAEKPTDKRLSGEKHSDNLIRQMMRQPCDLAALWGRAAEIRIGQEIYNRTQQYFKDYFDSLTEDMPNVEKLKDPFSDNEYLHWVPQKDCFYLDENIDDYLREVYEFVRK